jgi:thiamine kinase-like enzyme
MIPEAKKAGVARAMREAFGTDEFQDIGILTAGLSSALVFRIVVRGRPYLLRMITRTDAMNEPTRQFACMRAAADAGLAPRVWYTSTDDRISITDFVEARPLPAGESGAARLAATLRRLHALPPFPKLINYVGAVDGYIAKFQAAKILPDPETEELFRSYGRVASAYPRNDSELVSSHNDLKPENILFDGERVWLVDWEAAFLNDRYADLAVAANFFVRNDAEQETYLATYFGEDPGEYRRARFFLMRQVVHMFYAMVFMLLVKASGKPIDTGAKARDFRMFHDAVRAGEASLATDETKLEYARVHMSQLLQNLRTKQFEDALRIIPDRHANAQG